MNTCCWSLTNRIKSTLASWTTVSLASFLRVISPMITLICGCFARRLVTNICSSIRSTLFSFSNSLKPIIGDERSPPITRNRTCEKPCLFTLTSCSTTSVRSSFTHIFRLRGWGRLFLVDWISREEHHRFRVKKSLQRYFNLHCCPSLQVESTSFQAAQPYRCLAA